MRWKAVKGDFRIAGALFAFGLVLAVAFSFVGRNSLSNWDDVDSLFYEAQKLEVDGQPRGEALDRVFNSEIAQAHFPGAGRSEVDRYARHDSVYFRRRWTVPALAAAADPVFGEESLREVSLLGWALLAPFLYLLLRRRFDVPASVASTAFCMLLPPLVMWARVPMTDSWGLTVLVVCLLTALMARDDLRWLPAWIVAVLVGSVTRDLGLVLLCATGWLALRERSRRMALIAASGVLASLPALMIFTTPLRQSLTIAIEPQFGARSWGWILSHYPSAIFDNIVKADLTYPFHVAPLYALLSVLMVGPVLAGLLFVFRPGPRDPYLSLMRGAFVGGVLTVLIGAVDTHLRHSLILVPAIAVGLALLVEALLPRARRWRERQAVPAPPPYPAS
jgi:hypothetical protein